MPPLTWISLFVMSVVGILAVLLHFKQNTDANTKPSPTEASAIHDSPTPVEIAISNKLSEKDNTSASDTEDLNKNSFTNNIDLIAKNCSNMVTEQNSFAVFEHGTCVLLIEPLTDHVVSARSTLKLLADTKIDFEVKPLNNNNYLIIFDKYLFCWFSADQLAKNKDAMMQDKRLARRADDSATISPLSDLELRIGKLARLCLIADSNKLNIKKIIRAQKNSDGDDKLTSPELNATEHSQQAINTTLN
ncbi:MAG: hypothetical protein ACSHX6_10170 [Akkermansiaceae bacterium]